jgi:hypothetical protein
MRYLFLLLTAALLSCQGLERGTTTPESNAKIRAQLEKSENATLLPDSQLVPLSFKYEVNKDFIGDSTVIELSPRRDTLLFSYASYFDGSYGFANIKAFPEFKLYQVGPSSYEFLGKVVLGESDSQLKDVPKKYSLNVIAIPDKPFPPGTYRLVMLNVWPNYRRITTYESRDGEPDKMIRQDPEYEVLNTWTGQMDLPDHPRP